MMQWATQDIAQARVTPGVQWLVAVFHHPPYTKGTHDSDYEIELVEMRESYLPVLVSDAYQFPSLHHVSLSVCMHP